MSDQTQLPEIGAIALARYFWRQYRPSSTAIACFGRNSRLFDPTECPESDGGFGLL
jgi:hypothetical protein